MLDFLDADPGTVPNLSSIARSNTMAQAASSMSLASMAGVNADPPTNPEADSYAYMETLLEALASLGRLGSGLETLAQRMPGEIHTMVEVTLDEVEER